jgi:polysaccharide export outer membrane protein
MDSKAMRLVLSKLVVLCVVMAAGVSAQVNNYVVGPQDVLTIALFGQPDLGGKYTVEADGTFTFPLIGRVKAGGLTLREVEVEMQRLLADGFFKNPQVSVAIEQYRSQRVFVVGEVRIPGTYPLTGDMSLIEALSRAGSTTEAAGGEVLIVRPRGVGRPSGPAVVDAQNATADENTEVIRVDITELQSGRLSQNALLQDSDTIFVPRADLVYIVGQVRNPGSYPLRRGMTVLQALSLAGGVTDRGADGRIRVTRTVNGEQSELRVALDDAVQPGDTIVVPERFF